MTIPPNWEKAEMHGKANLVLNAKETKMDPEKPDTYCACCQMPFPEEEHYYGVCTDNKDLGDMGPGYPLMFEFMKMVGGLMFILSIIYFVPCAYMIW